MRSKTKEGESSTYKRWVLPKIVGDSSNAEYLKTLVDIHNCRVQEDKGSLRRYRVFCGDKYRNESVGRMKACYDIELLWKQYLRKSGGTFDEALAEKIKEKIQHDAERAYQKYCEKVHKEGSSNKFSPEQTLANSKRGFETKVRTGLLRIPRRCNGYGLTGMSTHFPPSPHPSVSAARADFLRQYD
eukprot:GHVU01112587.1.p1 GENE.GHVU01112587.1~~GHVU01112587.1.p1  ORF type:complete len:186 (-),score=20.33 GHVU01112587.1:57-614(-)